MKRKNLVILLIVFAILGIAVVIQEKSRDRRKEHVPEELGILYPSFSSERVSSVTLGSFGGDVVLKKMDGNWYVEDGERLFRADKESIEKMFETTEALEAIQIVSQNPEKHISFQVNSRQETEITDEDGQSRPFSIGTMGTEVKMLYEDGSQAAHFFVGKNGSMDFLSTYVRKAESPTVLLAQGYLKATYGKGNATAWKDLLICKIEPETIASVKITAGKDQIVIQQVAEENEDETPRSYQWKLTEPMTGPVDNAKLQQLLSMFKHFRAGDYAEEKQDFAEYGFDNPSVVIELGFFDSEEKEIFTFGNQSKEKSDQYYLQKSGSDNVYLIPQYRIETIPHSADELLDKTKFSE
ncbi:MAG: DUF4340 domain-containing protein [bacterium]